MSAFRSISPTLDARMLAFSVAVVVNHQVVVGLIPALQTTRLDLLRVWTGIA